MVAHICKLLWGERYNSACYGIARMNNLIANARVGPAVKAPAKQNYGGCYDSACYLGATVRYGGICYLANAYMLPDTDIARAIFILMSCTIAH